MTNFKPDQTSSTAHTLTSTKVIDKASRRIKSSLTLVATLDEFFGQDTQFALWDHIELMAGAN